MFAKALQGPYGRPKLCQTSLSDCKSLSPSGEDSEANVQGHPDWQEISKGHLSKLSPVFFPWQSEIERLPLSWGADPSHQKRYFGRHVGLLAASAGAYVTCNDADSRLNGTESHKFRLFHKLPPLCTDFVGKNKVCFPSVSLSLDPCRVTLVAPWTAASTASGLFTVWPALCPPPAATPTRSPPSSPARLPTSAGWTTWVWLTAAHCCCRVLNVSLFENTQ